MKAFKKEIYLQCDLMAIKKRNVACVYRRNISQYDSSERCGPWASCFEYCTASIYIISTTLHSIYRKVTLVSVHWSLNGIRQGFVLVFWSLFINSNNGAYYTQYALLLSLRVSRLWYRLEVMGFYSHYMNEGQGKHLATAS
jgi:hypothetical protein